MRHWILWERSHTQKEDVNIYQDLESFEEFKIYLMTFGGQGLKS